MTRFIVFLLIANLFFSHVHAQNGHLSKAYPDLSISYQLQVDSEQPMLGILLSGATCRMAFTDKHSSLSGEDALQQMSLRAYQDARSNEGLLLMQIFGKKQYIELEASNSSDLLSTFDTYADQLRKTNVTKEVAGWLCIKKVGRFVINDQSVDVVVYVADINYTGSHPTYGSIYKKLGGIPLRILVRNEYGIFQLEAQKITRAPLLKPITKSEISGYEKFDPNATEQEFPFPLKGN